MSKDIETTEKKALEKTEETTWAGQTYEPTVDIWESEQALVLQADVPGVKKDDVEINLDQDVLTISGRVSLDDYNGLRPVYSEFNVGNFFRRWIQWALVFRQIIVISSYWVLLPAKSLTSLNMVSTILLALLL